MLTDSVCVAFSAGKDSIVSLDLCCRHFKQVSAFFMYQVAGLSFQEAYLAGIERRFKIKIVRLPHWAKAEQLAVNYYRPGSNLSSSVPVLTVNDVEHYMRVKHGATWFAHGQKKNDSLERRAMISACGAVDVNARRFYPVADFSDKNIFAYLRAKRLPVPVDYQYWGHSFGLMEPEELRAVRDRYPKDWQKIVAMYPEIEAVIKRRDFYGTG